MGRARFVIFIIFLVVLGDFSLRWAREFNFAWRKVFRARVESELLAMRFRDVEFKKILIERERQKHATLIFVGDIMLSRWVEKKMKKEDDFRYPFLKITDVVRQADIAFGNLEGPVSARGIDQGSIYSFRGDPRAVEGLKYAGFDVLSLANNHVWDWGREALVDTIDILRFNGIQPIGAGIDREKANDAVILKAGNAKIAFFGYTTLLPKSLEAGTSSVGTSSFDLETTKKKIKELKDSGAADLVTVSFHWGEEYAKEPGKIQREIAHALIDAGADLVIGHHPHVMQEVERYKNGWTAYSLGNFVFDQNFSKETTNSFILRVYLYDRKISGVEQVPIEISKSFQPTIMGTIVE